jgi:hypothetical protein
MYQPMADISHVFDLLVFWDAYKILQIISNQSIQKYTYHKYTKKALFEYVLAVYLTPSDHVNQ